MNVTFDEGSIHKQWTMLSILMTCNKGLKVNCLWKCMNCHNEWFSHQISMGDELHFVCSNMTWSCKICLFTSVASFELCRMVSSLCFQLRDISEEISDLLDVGIAWVAEHFKKLNPFVPFWFFHFNYVKPFFSLRLCNYLLIRIITWMQRQQHLVFIHSSQLQLNVFHVIGSVSIVINQVVRLRVNAVRIAFPVILFPL